VDGASEYRVQLSVNSGFTTTIVDDSGISETQRTVSGLEHETVYYWRVRAGNSNGNSNWSQARSFTTVSDDSGNDSGSAPSVPQLSSPSNESNEISLSPTLSWESADGASEYRVQLSVNSGFTSTVLDDSGISETQRTVSDLEYETVYYWRVRAGNSNGNSNWSQARSFTTVSDDSAGDDGGSDDGSGDESGSDSGNRGNNKGPKKSTPANDDNKVSKRPTFKWESVQSAESYTIQVMESSTTMTVIDEQVADTIYTPGKDFQPNSKYEWRVRANFAGEAGEWSDIWEFTTDEEPEIAFETELNQNYPNPFNPTTQVRFTLTESQEVSLRVYDMAGRLVATLIDGVNLTSGQHEATFEAQSLASGIYFYRLITQTEIITRKMTLMK
jgi:hypothetical protein